MECTSCRAETELAQIEHRQAIAEKNVNKRGFGMSNVNEKNKRINFLNAYQNVSSAPENQKVSTHLAPRSLVLCVSCSVVVLPPLLHLSQLSSWPIFVSTHLHVVHQLYFTGT